MKKTRHELPTQSGVRPFAAPEPFDLDSRTGLRSAVRAVAVENELVLFTSNKPGLVAAANLALQLRKVGIEQHLVLAEARDTCTAGHRAWPWLRCGWSRGLPGFEGSFTSLTMGLNWKPKLNVLVRPEARWDWYDGSTNWGGQLPFDDYTSNDQFTLATDVVIMF